MNENRDDPRYSSDKSSMTMRQTLSDLQKNTQKFVQEHNELSKEAEKLKFKSYVEERKRYRSGYDPRYHTSSVRQELDDTLSKLQKSTHNFVRQHGELANRAEYLKYLDFVSQREKKSKKSDK